MNHCPVCGSRYKVPLSEEFNLLLYACLSCGTVCADTEAREKLLKEVMPADAFTEGD